MLVISDVTASPKTPGELNGAAPAGVTESEPACGSPVEGAVPSHRHPATAARLVQRTVILPRAQTQARHRHPRAS